MILGLLTVVAALVVAAAIVRWGHARSRCPTRLNISVVQKVASANSVGPTLAVELHITTAAEFVTTTAAEFVTVHDYPIDGFEALGTNGAILTTAPLAPGEVSIVGNVSAGKPLNGWLVYQTNPGPVTLTFESSCQWQAWQLR